jgi:hypothetical protein
MFAIRSRHTGLPEYRGQNDISHCTGITSRAQVDKQHIYTIHIYTVIARSHFQFAAHCTLFIVILSGSVVYVIRVSIIIIMKHVTS